MPVSSICNHNVATIDPEADMTEAAKRMREIHVGDLVVTQYQGGREVPIGVITDRDIVIEVIAKGVEPDQVKVGDAMSRDIVAVHDDNSIDFALKEMQRVGVRRLPVVDSGGKLIGVLAMDDVVDHLASQLTHIAGAIRTEQYIETKTRP